MDKWAIVVAPAPVGVSGCAVRFALCHEWPSLVGRTFRNANQPTVLWLGGSACTGIPSNIQFVPAVVVRPEREEGGG